ncbi:MAG: hypothetical protein V7638_4893 [Acidobacteriota bacterium]
MNTTKLPRFSAENALYSGARKYNVSSLCREHRGRRVEPQIPAGGGGGGTKRTCADAYGDCYIGCSVDHPESGDSANNLNAELREGCFDSCDAGYNTCSSLARSRMFSRLTALSGTKFAVAR